MKTAIVIGSFGCGNKGDDAILDGLYSVIGKSWTLIPTCGKYGAIESIVGDGAKVLPLRLNEGFSFSVGVSVFVFLLRYCTLLLKADAVIIGGGSLLHDLTIYNLPFYDLLTRLAKIFGVSIYFVGVGAGPIKGDRSRHAVAKILKRARQVLVRDPVDYDLLLSCGARNLTLSADNAFCFNALLPDITTILEKNHLTSGDFITMTASSWFASENFWSRNHIDFEKETNILLNVIKRVHIMTGKKVVFVPTVMHDKTLGDKLSRQLGEDWFVCIPDNYNCREMAAIIQESFFLFGMRMHSLIFAIRSGVPFVATIYDEKVRHLLQRIGMEKYMLEFNELSSEKFDEVMEETLRNYDATRTRLETNAEKLRIMASDNISHIFL